MKVYLLDTNIASALWDIGDSNHPKAQSFVQAAALNGDHIYISRIVIAEIEYGCALYKSSDPTRRNKALTAMNAYTAIRDIGKGTTSHYATIRAELFKLYAPRDSKAKIKNVRPEQLLEKTTALTLGIQENDLWMAAIAAEYNMTFVSDDNMMHIKNAFPSLDIIKWK
jgi:predicted nucleic acid-binding protein